MANSRKSKIALVTIFLMAMVIGGIFLWSTYFKETDILPISAIETYKLYLRDDARRFEFSWDDPPYKEIEDAKLRELLKELPETLVGIELKDEVIGMMGNVLSQPPDIILRGEEVSYYILTTDMRGNPPISNIWIGKQKNRPEPDVRLYGTDTGKYCRVWDIPRYYLLSHLSEQYGMDVSY